MTKSRTGQEILDEAVQHAFTAFCRVALHNDASLTAGRCKSLFARTLMTGVYWDLAFQQAAENSSWAPPEIPSD